LKDIFVINVKENIPLLLTRNPTCVTRLLLCKERARDEGAARARGEERMKRRSSKEAR